MPYMSQPSTSTKNKFTSTGLSGDSKMQVKLSVLSQSEMQRIETIKQLKKVEKGHSPFYKYKMLYERGSDINDMAPNLYQIKKDLENVNSSEVVCVAV